VEAIVRIALANVDVIGKSQTAAFAALFDGKVKNPQALSEAGKRMYAKMDAAFSSLGDAISQAERLGYVVEGAGAFAEARRQFAMLRSDFERRWPAFDESRIEAARQRRQRGEVLSLEDFSRELLRGD
jgi:hypothetical protein